MENIQIVFRVTRAVFAFAEMTNTDAGYCGPEFDFDKIIKDLMNKVGERTGVSVSHKDMLNCHNDKDKVWPVLCLHEGILHMYGVNHSDPKAADRQRLIESL